MIEFIVIFKIQIYDFSYYKNILFLFKKFVPKIKIENIYCS